MLSGQFAVFVSFVEVYNEYIYDLLQEAPAKVPKLTIQCARVLISL